MSSDAPEVGLAAWWPSGQHFCGVTSDCLAGVALLIQIHSGERKGKGGEKEEEEEEKCGLGGDGGPGTIQLPPEPTVE